MVAVAMQTRREDHAVSGLIQGLHVSRGEDWIVVRWEQPEEAREVVVLKSDQGYAEDLAEIFADDSTQRAIYFESGTQCQDQDLVPGVKYFYSVFAQAADGSWHRQGRVHATARVYRDEIEQVKFQPDGTFLTKLDTLPH